MPYLHSKKGMAVFGAVAFMLVSGWQFGVGGTEVLFSEIEVALEKAIAGSGAGSCEVSVSCSPDPNNYVKCSGAVCERNDEPFGSKWVKCDGVTTYC
jgi:hypothetical protein